VVTRLKLVFLDQREDIRPERFAKSLEVDCQIAVPMAADAFRLLAWRECHSKLTVEAVRAPSLRSAPASTWM
jgi:hypothetical protein